MKIFTRIAILLFACETLVAQLSWAAGPRESISHAASKSDKNQGSLVMSTAVAAIPKELEEWPRRLIGSFRVMGNVEQVLNEGTVYGPTMATRTIEGAANCVQVGTGAGVSCVIDATWMPVLWLNNPAPATSEYFTLHPAVLLFGIDPEQGKIRLLQVDDHSIALEGTGALDDDVLELKTSCGAYGPRICERTVRITARPQSSLIEFHIAIGSKNMRGIGGTRYTFRLQRLPEESGDN